MDHAYVEEHDLVESYLRDRLSDGERDAFEAHYFACETCLQQLEMANDFKAGMLQVAAEDTARARLGLLAGLARLARGHRLVLGGALLLLVALPLGLLMARNRSLERQLAEARAVRPTVPAGAEQRIASLEARLRAGTGDRQRLEEELAKERQARAAAESAGAVPQVNVPIFTLAAVRGEDAGREPVNRIPLSTTGAVLFNLELAAIDYPSYRASLSTADGREIWQAGGLRPNSQDALVLLLPSRMLGPGSYRLTLEGARHDGRRFAVGAYPFLVARQP